MNAQPRPAALKLSRLDHQADRASIRATIMRDRRTTRWFAVIEHIGTGMPAQAVIYRPTWAEAFTAATALLKLIDRIAMDEVHASRASRRDTRPTCSCAKLPGTHPAEERDEIISQAEIDQAADAWARRYITFNPDQIITTEEPA